MNKNDIFTEEWDKERPDLRVHEREVTHRFGRKLRFMRKSRSMTQLQLAIYLGIDRSYISDVERGRKTLSLPTMEIIAKGFRMSLSDLLKGI
jgi:transcriptional regulator with XRE-family HTH domain